jgi:hypothetical protein
MTLASDSPMNSPALTVDAAPRATDAATEKRSADSPEATLARRQERISKVLLWIGAVILIAFGGTWNLYVDWVAFRHATERPPTNCATKPERSRSPAGTATPE